MDDHVSSETTVLGLDNIPLELPVAGAGSRALAAMLDYLIVGILVILWGFVCMGLGIGAHLGWWALALFFLGFFVIEYGYFAGVEIAREGQTFGKWALGLRVVTRDGARPGTAALLLRNAVRSVDLVVGVPLMATRMPDSADPKWISPDRSPGSAAADLTTGEITSKDSSL